MKKEESKNEINRTVAYVFYFRDEHRPDNFIGILPERRKDKSRITQESIMKWGKLAAGINVDANSIWYVEVKEQWT